MKVFISWSGELSRELGEAFRNWLPSVLQAVKPYFTPNDIEKGARWSSDIANELGESKFGIFCLTRENITNQWLMFEAGAISKIVSGSHVCPILFELEPNDLSGPLNQFQLTKFNKIEIFSLVKSINKQLKENYLDDHTLEKVFEMWWPDLNKEVEEIFEKNKKKEAPLVRTDREILEEILSLTRLSIKQSKEIHLIDQEKMPKIKFYIDNQTSKRNNLSKFVDVSLDNRSDDDSPKLSRDELAKLFAKFKMNDDNQDKSES